MNWEKMFEWYIQNLLSKKETGIHAEFKPRPITPLRTDLNDIKLAYNLRGHLGLADVRPTGLLVRSKA
ncbi:MAG: hypothetical protein JWQ35_1887 [Bacteriovoracaceae bacterium]|nr:hypothetical protein [Bacteriovoracaceae bacterium]